MSHNFSAVIFLTHDYIRMMIRGPHYESYITDWTIKTHNYVSPAPHRDVLYYNHVSLLKRWFVYYIYIYSRKVLVWQIEKSVKLKLRLEYILVKWEFARYSSAKYFPVIIIIYR